MTTPITLPRAAAVAEAACFFGYPIVLMDRFRVIMSAVRAPRPATMQAPLNRFVHAPAPMGTNPDTLRSSAWLDLAGEPIVLRVPATFGRYYVVSMLDMWTDVFASIGPRTTGTGAGRYAIGAPGWNGGALPADVRQLNAPTRYVWLAVQTYAGGAGGEAAARATQFGFDLRPLSGLRRPPAASAAEEGGEACPRAAARAQIDAMDARTFFGELERLVAEHPPGVEDLRALDAARQLGLLSGRRGWDGLDADTRAAADAGVAHALASLASEAGRGFDGGDGRWLMCRSCGRYGADYRGRAAAAYAGIRDTPATDELCAMLRTDADGGSLSGRHRYLLRFAPDALPPARAFWSLSARPANDRGSRRFTVGNPDGLSLDRDGSLPIHIQCDRPAGLRGANWLPTPPGGFDIVLRLFWPTDDAIQRRWSPPAVERVG